MGGFKAIFQKYIFCFCEKFMQIRATLKQFFKNAFWCFFLQTWVVLKQFSKNMFLCFFFVKNSCKYGRLLVLGGDLFYVLDVSN